MTGASNGGSIPRWFRLLMWCARRWWQVYIWMYPEAKHGRF